MESSKVFFSWLMLQDQSGVTCLKGVGAAQTPHRKKTDFCLSSCDTRYIAVILDVLKKGDTTPKSGHQHLPNDSRVNLPRSVLKERSTLISPGLLLITNECFPGRKSSFIQYFLSCFSSFKQTPWFWMRSMQNSFTRCIPWMLRVVLRKAGWKKHMPLLVKIWAWFSTSQPRKLDHHGPQKSWEIGAEMSQDVWKRMQGRRGGGCR